MERQKIIFRLAGLVLTVILTAGAVSSQENHRQAGSAARKYGPPGRATLQEALRSIGPVEQVLTISPGADHWIIDDNLTIPKNITLRLERGAVLSVAAGKSLTIQGGFEAPLAQVFDGPGSIIFHSLTKVHPEWWGAKGDGKVFHDLAGADDTQAIQKAIDCLHASNKHGAYSNGSGVVELGNKVYRTNTLILKKYVSLKGSGLRMSAIIFNSFKTDGIRISGAEGFGYNEVANLKLVSQTPTKATGIAVGPDYTDSHHAGITVLRNLDVSHFHNNIKTYYAAECELENIWSQNAANNGYEFVGGTKFTEVTLLLKRCVAISSGNHAFFFNGTFGDVTIIGGGWSTVGGNGLRVAGTDNTHPISDFRTIGFGGEYCSQEDVYLQYVKNIHFNNTFLIHDKVDSDNMYLEGVEFGIFDGLRTIGPPKDSGHASIYRKGQTYTTRGVTWRNCDLYNFRYDHAGAQDDVYESTILRAYNESYAYGGTYARQPKVLHAKTDTTDSSGTDETVLASVTIPKGMLNFTKGLVRITAAGSFVNAQGPKTLKLYWGTNLVNLLPSTKAIGEWRIFADIVIMAYNTQRLSYNFVRDGGAPTQASLQVSQNLRNDAITLKITGQCSNGADRVRLYHWTVEKVN